MSSLYVSSQMTLTADELILHKISATYDIEKHRFYAKSAHQLLRSFYKENIKS